MISLVPKEDTDSGFCKQILKWVVIIFYAPSSRQSGLEQLEIAWLHFIMFCLLAGELSQEYHQVRLEVQLDSRGKFAGWNKALETLLWASRQQIRRTSLQVRQIKLISLSTCLDFISKSLPYAVPRQCHDSPPGWLIVFVRGIIIRCKINDISKIVSADSNIRRSHALFLDSEVLVHNCAMSTQLDTQILGGFIMELVRDIIICCKINDISKIVSADSNIRRSHALFLDSEVLVHNCVKGH